MKSLYVLLFALLISKYICDESEGSDGIPQREECEDKEDANSVSDCSGLRLSEGGYICCYAESEYTENGVKRKGKACVELTKSEYDNIDKTIEAYEALGELGGLKDVDIDIDCAAHYIFISLLSLLLFLF